MAGSMAAAQALAAREQQLAGIAQQLASVVQELRQLPPTVPDTTPGLPGVEQGLGSVSLQRASSTASASDTDQESRAKTRPSFYPHMPTKRRALLDGLESRSANEILDALKLDDYSCVALVRCKIPHPTAAHARPPRASLANAADSTT